MKGIIVSIFMIISALCAAQTYELGVWAGGANVVGDVGKTNYIAPNAPAIGGVFKWNRSDRHSFRATLTYAKLSGDDADSDDPSRVQRGYSYDYGMLEGSVGIEYTFWEWELYSGKPQFTPYLYTGLTAFQYRTYAVGSDGLEDYGRTIDLAVPMVLGVKKTLSRELILALEVGARYTLTDNLDGSSPVRSKEDFPELRFGNLNNNDWYVFTGLTLTYTFGRQPCYCNF